LYVSGADNKLWNNATQVVLMRVEQRTVLSCRTTTRAPPEGFALVIPVPVVLQKENVKTLPRAIFDRVDQLTSPRLVEYLVFRAAPVKNPLRSPPSAVTPGNISASPGSSSAAPRPSACGCSVVGERRAPTLGIVGVLGLTLLGGAGGGGGTWQTTPPG
jgi:hypothetical protein